jgi:hypothetical protein
VLLWFVLLSLCMASSPRSVPRERPLHAEEHSGRRVHRSELHIHSGRRAATVGGAREEDLYERNGLLIGRNGIPEGRVWTQRYNFYDTYGQYRLAENYTLPPFGKDQGLAQSIRHGQLKPEPDTLNQDMPANFWFGEQVPGGRWAGSVEGKPWMRQARAPPAPAAAARCASRRPLQEARSRWRRQMRPDPAPWTRGLRAQPRGVTCASRRRGRRCPTRVRRTRTMSARWTRRRSAPRRAASAAKRSGFRCRPPRTWAAGPDLLGPGCACRVSCG